MNWVFLKTDFDAGSDEGGDSKRIDLNTTEQEFIAPSAFDRIGGQWADEGQGSLHRLDPEAETLTTLCSLRLVHKPRFYDARHLSHPLDAVLIAPKTGEFVHPGERESWQKERVRREELRLQKERDAQQQEEEHQKWLADAQLCRVEQQRLDEENQEAYGAAVKTRSALESLRSRSTSPLRPVPSYGSKEGTCRFCGVKTGDWYYFDSVTKICECNACLKRNNKTLLTITSKD